ncbi:unnamed protein product, partial [Polarella glacialis]
TPSLLVREDSSSQVSSAKIAGFDLNDTLVSSKIGAPGYSVTISDWKLYNDRVLLKLREAHEQGYKLVMFTNQGNIKSALEGKRSQAFKAYVDAFLQATGLPFLVLAATQRDRFRKPDVGMWEYVEQKANAGLPVNRSESFYVGDAAGGEGEHSADDVDFARAVGVKFHHARDFFGPPGGSAETAGSKRRAPEVAVADGPKPAKMAKAGLGVSVEKGLQE